MRDYFDALLKQVEGSSEIQNDGKDAGGFYLPTRTLLLRHLTLLRDLHDKPLAHARVKDAWTFVVENLPPEWLVMSDEQKRVWREILKR